MKAYEKELVAISPEICAGIETTLVQGSEAWHTWRKKGIGATDAAAICGYSKWDTALSIYVKKTTEQKHTEQTQYQEWGHRIEPLLVDKLVEYRNIQKPTVKRGWMYTRDWMKCSLDAEYTDFLSQKNHVIECKTGRSSGDWSPVPPGYYAQVQWQMLITGYPKAIFSVLCNGNDWFDIEVEYDKDYAMAMYDKCELFWTEHVLKGVPPLPTQNSGRDYNALLELRGHADIQPPIEITKEELTRYLVAKENFEKAEDLYTKAKAQLAFQMANGSNLAYEGKLVAQYVERKGTETIDKKLLLNSYPDIYNECKKIAGKVSYIKYL